MSSGYKIGGSDLYNYLQPYFAGSDLTQLSGFKINGIQAFARRDNNPNNAPTASNLGYKVNGVDISQYGNRVNASLTIQITGNKIYNGQGQQANIVLISPTDSWITVQTTTVTDVGLYDSNYFSYTPPNGYNLTINFSYFSIDPSEINIISNGGPTSFTWTGGNITFSNYTVSGVFPADSGWFVSDTDRTDVGSYYAYLSTSSQNYVLGTLQSINWTIVPTSVPGPPIIGASSAGDKSFTANWSAPSVTGGEITGYYVSFSTNGGQSWEAEQTTTSTTYTWSGNGVIFNGNSYIARVRAYNSLGNGSYSGNPTGVIPTFAAPTITIIPNTPSTGAPNVRNFSITFSPTPCVNYSNTIIYIRSPYDDFGGYYTYVNGSFSPIITPSSAANQNTGTISSVYAQNAFQGSQFYPVGTNQTYNAYCITYNNDGYGVQSAVVSGTTSPTLYSPPVYTEYGYSDQTGTFNCASRSFSQTSVYSIPNSDTRITSLTVFANTVAGVTICTTSRAFVVYFSRTSTSGGTGGVSLTGLQAPWSTNSGTTYRSLGWAESVTYGNPGAGRITVTGRAASSLSTWPTQPQNVYVVINGLTRVNTGY